MSKLGFWALAEADPDRVALVEADGTEVPAGRLLANSHRLLRALREQGLQPGETLTVALSNRRELLECCLAALQGGCYFAAVSPHSSPATFQATQPSLLVLEGPPPPGVAAPYYVVGGEPGYQSLLEAHSEAPPEQRRPGDLMLITSGSSGEPKGVKRPLRRLTMEKLGKLAAAHLNAVCGIRPRSGAVHLVASPLYHSASLLWCLDHLHVGHRVVFDDGAGARSMLERMERYRVTGSLMVPTHFYRLLALPPDLRQSFDSSALKHVVHTGAPCPPQVKRRMLDWWGPVIYEVYGAAEGAGTRVTPEEWLARPGTVGRSFGRVKILRPDGSECLAGEVGRVHLKAAGRPFAPEKFFWVGDLGYLDEEEYLFLRGREDQVILTGGCKVYPVEVEAVLQAHPRVGEVEVVGVPDSEWGMAVQARLVADEVTEEELRQHCRERLEPPQCPRCYVFVEELAREKGLL